MKRIALLGSTGSIGQQTLEVVRAHPKEFTIAALAAGANTDLLRRQILEFRPALAHSPHLAGADGLPCRLVSLEEMVTAPQVELAVIATAGKAGLLPTLAALKAGKQVALANKEALVIAGELVMAQAKAGGVTIRPIDSEHSAVWQCLWGEQRRSVARLLLTASGGAFRDYTLKQLAQVTLEQALRHPTWLMGPKVTIDSATLMNKGLEVMEAHWLFDLPYPQIQVIIHRESIVHSLVEFVDGSLKAQLSPPDMRLPIQCALAYPERLPNSFPRLDLLQHNRLSFAPVDLERYPCLKLARQAGEAGGTYPAVLSAADEEAVALFLAGRLPFTGIAGVVADVMDRHQSTPHPDLETILAADVWARERVAGGAGGWGERERGGWGDGEMGRWGAALIPDP